MYIFGIAILVFGLAFLLRNLGFLDFSASFWSVFYPVVIIAIGGGIILATHKGKQLLRKIKQLFDGNK